MKKSLNCESGNVSIKKLTGYIKRNEYQTIKNIGKDEKANIAPGQLEVKDDGTISEAKR